MSDNGSSLMKFFGMTLDEMSDQIEREACRLGQEWESLGKCMHEAANTLSLPDNTEPTKWLQFDKALRQTTDRVLTLELMREVYEEQSRLPGFSGYVGRLFGGGRRPGSYHLPIE